MLHAKETVFAKSHYLLFHLVGATHPRWLVTLDESLKRIEVPVRVGQAVDVTGVTGNPKKITGWQTHKTPVLLSHNERAELVDPEEWISLSSVLEGIVILQKNPNYTGGPDSKDDKK